MKKFFHEFKEFALKGNVLDLSVAVIIGAAFQSIINSVVNDLINPVLSLLVGGINFSDLFIPLKASDFPIGDHTVAEASLEELEKNGIGVFNYGSFITAVINFIIMAFVIFLLVKLVTRITSFKKKEEAPAAPTTKKCPFCCSEIDIKATRCPHCTSELPETEEEK